MPLSTSPFPEANSDDRPSENTRTRGRIRGELSSMPVGNPSSARMSSSSRRGLDLPKFPTNPDSSPFSGSTGTLISISAMPVLTGEEDDQSIEEIIDQLSSFKTEGSGQAAPVDTPSPPTSTSPFQKDERAQKKKRRPSPSSPTEADEFRAALFPMVEDSVQQALYGPRDGLQTYLEPMLRNTVRRAIAEQMETAHLFQDASSIDRLVWHVKALLTSRTYDEIVFEHTKRYQVEELYLFSEDLKWIISYASQDPARHGSQRKVKSTVRLLRSRLSALRDEDYSAFQLPEGRIGVLREGKHTVLVAVLRGHSNALIRSDLDYLQFQIEERYGRELRDPENVFHQSLQPILEGGLLIQAPPASQ